MDILDSPPRMEDAPEEFRINRFSFRFDVDADVFVVKQEKPTNYVPLIAALLFGALTVLFMIVGISAYQAEGFEATAMVMLFFFLLGIVLTSLAVYKMRFDERKFAFHSDELLITSNLRSLRYARSDFESAFVQTTITRDYLDREISFRVDVVLIFSPQRRKFGVRKLELFHLDGKRTTGALFGRLDREEMDQVQKEGERIARVLETFWDLPVSVG